MVMRLRAFNFFLRETMTSLKRNSWMGIASAGTVAVSLIVFGLSLLIVANTNYITGNLESDVTIAVYLNNDIGSNNTSDLKDEIKKIDGVSNVTFVSKDQALSEFKKQLGDKKDMLDALEGGNPLPDQFRVKTNSANKVNSISKEIQLLDGVDKVNYGQGIVEKLFAITKWLRWIGYAIMALLGLAAVFLISTTIRLALFSRRKEVQIMKFVGATDWFIRWPYLLEGMFIGLSGALMAIILITVVYTTFVSYVHQTLPFVPVQSGTVFMLGTNSILALTGITIGAIGSLISIRKYLRV